MALDEKVPERRVTVHALKHVNNDRDEFRQLDFGFRLFILVL